MDDRPGWAYDEVKIVISSDNLSAHETGKQTDSFIVMNYLPCHAIWTISQIYQTNLGDSINMTLDQANISI